MNEADLNIIVSNVVNENRYKHCRLCLKEIHDNFFPYDDCVSFGTDYEIQQPIGVIISGLLGGKICEEIPGVDAVCADCAEKVLEFNKFVELCERSTTLLNKIFNNLYEALDIQIESINKDQSLYVMVGEEESKIVLLDKEQKHEIESQHACDTCELYFDSIEDLKAHKLENHGNALLTSICQQKFSFIDEAKCHRGKTRLKFKCPECDQYISHGSLEQHQEKAHTFYVCKECGKAFRGLEKLKSHEEKHNTKNDCPKCGKTYLTKDFYLKHVKLCLTDQIDPHPFRAKIEKKYFCEKCGKGYSTSGGLRVHDRFEHGDAKPHVCKTCGKKFTAPSYLKIHMVKHTGEKNFPCNICSNKFVSKEALLYHVRRHTGEKPYSCKMCSEKFVNSSARAEHIKFKHTSPSLTCDICNKKFFTPNFLKQHINCHLDPSSKLYSGRNMIPPNMPGEQNMRNKCEDFSDEEES